MKPDNYTPASERQSTTFPELSNVLPPLVVDLDGTLVKTDLLIESLFMLLRQSPLSLFALPFWLLKGRAYFKHEIAVRVRLDVALLPYCTVLLEHLRVEREEGRFIVLGTASDERLAQQVADHLNLFDSILASDGRTNLSGELKRERLVSQFGESGFDYVGNSKDDMAVWSSARGAVVVNPSKGLVATVAKVTEVQTVFQDRRATFREYLSVLRPQHWLKNFLVFVPMFAEHRFHETALLWNTLLTFLALCCCASSGYLFNDLFDLSPDRHHPTKRLRPFVSGKLPLWYGLFMFPTLVILGSVLAVLVSWPFVGVLSLYVALTLAYSLSFKKVVLLDVIVLAGLYTFRIMAGALGMGIWPSEWLFVLSTFLFLSLALAKRYGELVVMRRVDGDHARARSYEISDAELLAAQGTASGYIAVLVLALYITSGEARLHYGRYQAIWLLCPILFYWVSYIWMTAHRGKMDVDPIVFALRDRTSRILIALMLFTAFLAI